MGNRPSACLSEATKCVDHSSHSICTQDVISNDEASDDDGYDFFIGRENTNGMCPGLVYSIGPYGTSYDAATHVSYSSPCTLAMPSHLAPRRPSYSAAHAAAAPAPVVLPTILRQEWIPPQDSHLYGRPFEHEKAEQVQNTINGLLGDIKSSYPSYTPVTSYTPAPLHSVGQLVLPASGNTTPAGPGHPPRFCTHCGTQFADSAKFCGACGAKRMQWPLAGQHPPVEQDSDDMDAMLRGRGVILGRGHWAEALRGAKGPRRDSLLLLVMLDIVTQRELADDLTEISKDHIEDCVDIAAEMLIKWPPHLGSPSLQDGKAFFEQRLAQIHSSRSKPPSPSGYYNVLAS